MMKGARQLQVDNMYICSALKLDNSICSTLELKSSTCGALELDSSTFTALELDNPILRNFDESKANNKS